MLYRPGDFGDAAREQQLVKQLHDLAGSIHAAKLAQNVPAVQGLWTQFQAVAQEYAAVGGNERAILALVNSVHDSVIASVQEVSQTAGQAAASALGLKNLWPLAIVAILAFAAPQIVGAMRPRRRAA